MRSEQFGLDFLEPMDVDLLWTMEQDELAFEATMNAVIIYDDLDIAAKAQAALERAAHRADEALLWTVELLRLDMLILPPTAEAALREAAEAHLVVLGVRQAQLLPDWLLDWLEQWATRRQIQDAALALFDGGKGDTLSAPPAPELSQFAERHGLSFIFGDVGPTEDESAVFARRLREREVSVTSTLRHIMDEPTHDYYRGWGINE
jgi:hypothetical protein